MTDKLKAGDKVSWKSHGGEAHGKVVKKQTAPTRIKDHKVAASPENPQYIVATDEVALVEGFPVLGEEFVGELVEAAQPWIGEPFLDVAVAETGQGVAGIFAIGLGLLPGRAQPALRQQSGERHQERQAPEKPHGGALPEAHVIRG